MWFQILCFLLVVWLVAKFFSYLNRMWPSEMETVVAALMLVFGVVAIGGLILYSHIK